MGRAEWLKPYTEAVVRELAQRGVKRLDAICPGFAVDCLETIDEIGHECDVLFRAHGGESLRYIPALNESPAQVRCWRDCGIAAACRIPGCLNLLGRFLEIALVTDRPLSAWESFQQLGFAPADDRRHLVA